MYRIIALILTLSVAGCAATQPHLAPDDLPDPSAIVPETEVAYRVFLLGELTSAPSEGPFPTLDLLRRRMQDAGPQSAIVCLGNCLHPDDLPDSTTARRATPRLTALLNTLEAAPGRIVVVPGIHEWDEQDRNSLARIETFLENSLNRGNVVLPDDGFPGPVELELTEAIRLIVLDTQWWFVDGDRGIGETEDYEIEEPGDVLIHLNDLIARNDDHDLLIVGHHPMMSSGRHGGRFPFREHLFPFTTLHPAALVPLPIVGSLYPLYRRYIGKPQDLIHERYAALRRALAPLFRQHEHLVYAAAHDPGLQYVYTPRREQHHLVSGGAGTPGFTARDGTFSFVGPGYMTLTYYTDGSVWLEGWTPDGANGRRVLHTQIHGPLPEHLDPEVEIVDEATLPDYRDSVVVQAVNPDYQSGRLRRLFFGRNYRDAWATPVTFPVLDLGREAGGLTPIKRGGSAQTLSLRLENPDGREYVLRSLDKSFKGTQEALKGTFAADLLQDQISMIHPFAAFIIPPLADAAGIYHTNPRPVFVPDDPRLGRYQDLLAGRLMLFEERPNDDMRDVPSFGRPKDVSGFSKLYREITDDNDHRIDTRMFARARLFDMWISDWDRHFDQWRWAEFEPYELDPTLKGDARTEGKIYRPIPRDRDWAFFRFDGLVAPFGRYVLPEYQPLRRTYGFLPGLTLKGRMQDRRLLSSLERADWLHLADSLRTALTDAVIEAAVRQWPDSIFALDGEDIIEKLKGRRDQLPEVAETFYRFHARVVDVVGSNKHERFEVHRRNDEETEVTVYKTSKEGEIRKPIYRRTFRTGETREIRLYGLDGQDRFVVTGEVRDGPRLIAVGGPGEDTFTDASRVAGFREKNRFYDTPEGNEWNTGPETKRLTSRDPVDNIYNMNSYRPDRRIPLTFFGSNRDEGVYLGGGVRLIRHGFRKEPYAHMHRIAANVATRTGGSNAIWESVFTDAIGAWSLRLEGEALLPGSFRNYYGLGNESANTVETATFYEARLEQISLAGSLIRRLPHGFSFFLGPSFAFTRVRQDEDRFISQPQAGLSPNAFGNQWFTGFDTGLSLENVDRPLNPRQGFRWRSSTDVNLGLTVLSDSYARFISSLTLYASPVLSPQVTFAIRAGGAHNVGAFPFFRANTLGGRRNLRGYRSTRFAGRSSLYTNVELRTRLLTFNTYLAVGELGILGLFDTGRVWTDGEASNRWHSGYGGGLWATFFDAVLLSGTVAASSEERTFTLRLGFLY